MTFESVQDLFSRAAAQHGARTAIDRAGTGITYRDLDARSNRLANLLLAGGAARGSVVAILVDDRITVVTAMLAVLKAGCAFAPLDPNAPAKRLAAMVAEAEPAWFLAEARLLPLLEGMEGIGGARVVCLEDVKEGDTSHPGLAAGPDDMAYLYFTSGSTGRPKGIAGRLQGIDHFIRWEIETLGIGPGARVSQLTTPSFDAFLRDVFVPLCAGGTVCVPESREAVLDASRLIDWLDLEEIELVHCVPSLFRSILNGGLSPGYFAAMKHVLLAGEPLLPADVGRWMDVFGERIRLVNLYGPSETTMTKLFYFVTTADRERKSIPIGKPMPGAQALVIGANGKAAPPGTIGEILLRTPYRSLGYYRQPELTAEAFVQNPFNPAPSDVVYRTGDLGRLLKDGNFEFLGRRDSQVKIRGVRVEIAEVENQLRSHPAVRDVVVVDRDNAAGGKSLYAYVVLGEETDANALREALLANLPEAFVPDGFVPLDELPRTLTGKVDRKALPSPESARLQDAAFTAPRSLTEELLAGIWCELLELKQVGIHQSFFAVGGHSLLATQLLSRIRSTFEVELPLNRLFEAPTIAGLAEGVEAARRAGDLPPAPPIERAPREGRLPLSYAQRSLWLTDRMEPGNAAYNISNALVLTGPLSVPALRGALGEVVRRHEVLRTTFPTIEGEPVQRIAPAGPADLLPLIDLSALPADLKSAEQRRLAAETALRPFRLDRDALLRGLLLRLEGEEHALLVTVHHIVSDAWSTSLLVREWTALYAAALEGRPSPLPELPIQYADFAAWQRAWLRGEVRESLLAYWRGQLAGSPTALDMPTDRPRPAVQTYRGAAEVLRLPRALKEGLEGLSRGASTTLFMTLLSAFAALLSRRSGQTDVVVGTPTAGRGRREIEDLIGFFVNPLALRVDLSGSPSFQELLVRVRRTVLEALAHQDLPFEMLVEELQPVRDRSRSPIFQAKFQLQNVPVSRSLATGLGLKPLGHVVEAVKLDLDLNLGEVGDGLGGALEYRTDLFDRATAERLLRHFQLLLETAVAAPDRPLQEIELLTGEERRQLLTWGTNAGPRPSDTFLDVLAARAAQQPDALAVVLGDQTLTYAELDHRANQLARHLAGLGVGPEVLVGLAMERSANRVVGLLGILKAGAAYLPLDPSYPAERLALMLDDAQPPVLLTEDEVIDALPQFWGFTVNLDADEAFIGIQSGEPLATGIGPENTAYVIFTSGSTGEPKGVRLTHRGLRNLAEAQLRTFGVTPADQVLQFASLSFDASVFEIAMALCAGATLHMAPRKELMPGPGFVQLLRERGITNVTLPPSVLAMLPPEELPALETVVVAGEACPTELVARWAPGRQFWNAYGPTETTVWASTALCTGGERKPTIGHPVPNAEIHILDRDLRPVPAGVPGVLHIGGLGLAAGYLNRPALTAERFIPHPFATEPGARLYDTGDLARWLADGQIDFLGRVDHQVKLRAFRIELGEIEAVLGRHSAVREAVVLLRGEAPGQRLVAYLVCHSPNPATAELRDLLARHLPEYMMPSAFVFLDALPLRPNGKIDRDALPDPEQVRSARQGRVAPRNPVEEALAGLWEEILGVSRIGVEDDFFELGGYSLAATQVLNRVRDLFGVELDFDTFFQVPTVAAVAAAIGQALETGGTRRIPPLEPAPRDGGLLPLSYPQELLWRDEQRAPGLPGAHVTSAVRLSGALDHEALARALDEIVRRHEALRTVFPVVDGAPGQRIEPAAHLALRTVDLRHLSPAARAEAAADEMEREVRQPFDLAAGPLARGLLLQEDETEHVLLLVCHHIVIDQWSAGVFTRELAALYQAFSQGQPSPLPELPLQYADYAVWQRQWLQGEALEEQLAYWRGQLAGAEPLALPTDHPRGDRQRGPSAGSLLTLSWDLTEALHALSRKQGTTLFMTLLAAFEVLLHAETGQDDVLVDFPIANRRRREIEPLIGFFPNRLLLRTRLEGRASYLDLLRRVQKVTLDAYTHQDLPYEVLLEETGLARDLLRVSCNFYNAPSDPLVLEGLELTPVNVRDKVMDVDLFFLLQEREDGLACGFFYRTDLFEPATIRRIERRFHALLEAIVKDPSQSLPELVHAMDRTVDLMPGSAAPEAAEELFPVPGLISGKE